MKALSDVLTTFESRAFDGRDIMRLAAFVTDDQLSKLGLERKPSTEGEEQPIREVLDWTRENVLVQLQNDLAFAFEKALGKRGLSARCMYAVISMWNTILEEGLENMENYRYYGLPLLKATAMKYGFDNPIGDDTGSEEKYNE